MKSSINYIFSIGYRCYSSDFLNIYKLRKISGPFDYLFIDFETALKIINNNFNNIKKILMKLIQNFINY